MSITKGVAFGKGFMGGDFCDFLLAALMGVRLGEIGLIIV